MASSSELITETGTKRAEIKEEYGKYERFEGLLRSKAILGLRPDAVFLFPRSGFGPSNTIDVVADALESRNTEKM